MAGEHAGRSLIEILWEQLDIQYANLMTIVEDGKSWNVKKIVDLLEHGKASKNVREDYAGQIVKHLELKGKVAGLAYAIAKITNPYGEIGPAMEAIRAEAAERWEAEYGSDEYEEEDEDEDGDL